METAFTLGNERFKFHVQGAIFDRGSNTGRSCVRRVIAKYNRDKRNRIASRGITF